MTDLEGMSREELVRANQEMRARLVEYEQELGRSGHLKRELADKQLLSEALLGATSDAVIITDPVGTVIEINHVALARMGLPREDILGRSVYDFYPAERVSERKRWINEVVEARKPVQYKDTEDNTTFGHRLYPYFDPHTNRVRIAIFTRDITDSEMALRALRESEERYRAILEDQTELICRYLPDGRLSYVNEAYARFFGKNRRELIHTNFIPHIPEEDLVTIERHITSLRPDKPVTEFEHRIIRENGEVWWQHWTHRAIFDESGNLAEYQAVGRSINKRKTAEKALRDSERRYKSLFEDSPISLWEEDFSDVRRFFDHLRDTGVIDFRDYFDNHPEAVEHCVSLVRILDVNRATVEFLKARDKGLLMQGLDLVFIEDSRVSFKEELIVLAEGGRQFRSENRIRTLEGDLKHVVVHLVVPPGQEGALEKVIVSVLDVTERKRAEESLNEHRAFLHQIIDTVPSPIFVKDRNGAFLLVNRAMAEMYGTTISEMIGRHGADFNPREDENAVIKAEDEVVFESREPLFIPQRTITHASGEERWYSTTKLPLPGKEQLLGVAVDITQQILADRERNRMERHLRQAQKMQALGTLAGGIAHDFNNMIFAIMGFVRLARKKADGQGKLLEYLDQIGSAGTRASELVRQILTFSRQSEQERKAVQLLPLFKETAKMMDATLPSTIEVSTLVELDTGNGEDTVLGDPAQVHQVLMNLCTNAGHAMRDSGGRLAMSLRRRRLDEDQVRFHHGLAPGEYVEIGISDTGHGISPSHMEHIFDPFFTTKKPGEGTGMGLSVVHGIVRNMGGAVMVESTEREGATFRVLLPAHHERAESSAEEEAMGRGRGERIMFVDDEQLLVDMSRDMISQWGYEIQAYVSPEEAWEVFIRAPDDVDLVITDQTMPVLTGLELSQRMLSVRPDLPVILLTGYSELVSPDQAKAMGLADFIMKPVVEESLAAAVRRALDKAGQGRNDGQSAAC